MEGNTVHSSPHPTPNIPSLVNFVHTRQLYLYGYYAENFDLKVMLAQISFLAKSVTTFTKTLGALRLGFHALSTFSMFLCGK